MDNDRRQPRRGQGGRQNAFRENAPGGSHDQRNRNHFRENGRDHARPKRNFPIGYKKLEELLLLYDAQLILQLTSESTGFLLLLQQTGIKEGLMCLVLNALAKVSECATDGNTQQMLIHFFMKILPTIRNESNFFSQELRIFISYLPNRIEPHFRDHERYAQSILDLLKFIRKLQLTLFKRSCDVVSNIAPLITSQIEYINRKGNYLGVETTTLLADINSAIEKGTENQEENEKAEVLLEPPDDFRTVSIFPTANDIVFDHEPFIRKNIIDGKYVGGVDHYLDVQFRLLREDFVRPLREGISEYLRLKRDQQEVTKMTKIKDVNIYFNVHLIKSVLKSGNLIYTVQFDAKKFKNIRWQASKRFLHGSLVCLTADEFQTFCFATVAGQRNPEALERGQFQICFQFQDQVSDAITPMTTLTMVESQVYFEAYRHNLLVLQDLTAETFPLKRYVIDVERDVLPPPYVNNLTSYDLSKTIVEFSATKDEDNVKINDYELAEKVARCSNVMILHDEQWPKKEYFGLDDFQFAAYKAALTKQFVVIQGPPGTGKTFIGLKIAKALLGNSDEWKIRRLRELDSPPPILVVCYTNHALDQFLEGILQFCDNIVRIGAKSQSEVLQAYNLITLKMQLKHNRKVPSYIYQNRWESNARLKSFQEDMAKLETLIEATKKEILGPQLSGAINQFSEEHYSQLTGNQDLSCCDKLMPWLGYQVHMDHHENENYDSDAENDTNGNATNGNAANGADDGDGDDAESLVDEQEVQEIENMRQFDVESDEEEEIINEALRSLGNRVVNYVPVELQDGFQMQRHERKRMKANVQRELKSKDVMTAEEARSITNIWRLNAKDRWRLYRFWLKLYIEKIEDEIKLLRTQYTNEWKHFTTLRNQEDIEIVKGRDVIAMTTTGAAKYHHIIAAIKPRIVIVEEAAEVLEAHIITSLCRETEHLILIGDHQQLKPNPAVYELARKFNLEVSLFERMLTNGLNCYQLKTQHRMRPCISELLVPHIYKELLDHPSVHKYENIKGISCNMYFVNHNQLETNINDTKSRMNLHEAKFAAELCRYLILQGYKTSQITILTMYSGQLYQVRNLIRNIGTLKGVRATVVDNYQGEENDIIIMTFVRSNIEGEIGFLKVSNRVNVSLSRARKALYCIGNFDCLAEKSPLWQTINKILQNNNAFGKSLPIYCQNHPEVKNLITTADDFKQAPEGGCLLPCGARLPCGHVCPSTCHILDAGHEETKCYKKCEKPTCEQDHRCMKDCHYEVPCGPCERIMPKHRQECGHTVHVKCSESATNAKCRSSCNKMRLCGHKCLLSCYMNCETAQCQAEVDVIGPCKHSVKIRCSQKFNEKLILDSCRSPCNTELDCGHTCRGSCGQCKQGRLHIRCKESCSKTLICGHRCKESCSVSCPPCTEKCTIECGHSKCKLKCGTLCAPCAEKCTWRCEHLQCTKLCNEFCDRQLCDQPCKKQLKCEHPCIGICGEPCPKLCRICNKDEVEEIFFGTEDEPDARFIQMVDCPHFIEVTELIKWLKMEASQDANSVQMKTCPKCKAAIRKTKSLNTFIQCALKDIELIKAKTVGEERDNRENQLLLHNKINQKTLDFRSLPMSSIYFREVRSLYSKLWNDTQLIKKRRAASKTTLLKIKNILKILEEISDIFKNTATAKQSKMLNIDVKTIETLENRTLQSLAFLHDFNNSKQHQIDITNEVTFLDAIARILKQANEQPFVETGKRYLKEAFQIALNIGRVTEQTKVEFKKLIDEANKHATGLGISAEEKTMIMNAMGFQQGHWYKCPNGHVYCIADCGGATMESNCNECGAIIGGGGHMLRRDNALATEMDGARQPAWPTNLIRQLEPFME